MKVQPVACLTDNYAYLLSAEDDGPVVVVDPSEPAPVLAALRGRPVAAIWCTHHHGDHVGGVAGLRARFPRAPVVGSAYDAAYARIPQQDVALTDRDAAPNGGAGLPPAVALHVPGHTRGALAYLVDDDVFTGDTLFAAGCGRLFEGDPATMRASLARLRALPGHVRVWCGHEYTERNLAFARTLTPDDVAVAVRARRVEVQRASGRPTVPSTIEEERRTNPFFRWDDEAMADAFWRLAVAEGRDPGSVDVGSLAPPGPVAPVASADAAFGLLRRAKDRAP